ncbi:hypothetical protein BS47DRAFT_1341799 [Hydnum rufescens UP504]|uniref:Uncharacterized protein n=1 Tax=Hydnum rufescens UP504 TaxID=1448309 RepID=A0A9P6DY63_9AGAM|nr:hypothetical protein BS47DRAFT_1341799 [Hydnum rufescens UP504]
MITINVKRIDAFSDMMDVSNKLFSLLLTPIKDRAKRNDFSLQSSAPSEWSVKHPTSSQ